MTCEHPRSHDMHPRVIHSCSHERSLLLFSHVTSHVMLHTCKMHPRSCEQPRSRGWSLSHNTVCTLSEGRGKT